MRKVAKTTKDGVDAQWIILFACPDGVYVFPCASDLDGSAIGDEWYATVAEADAACLDVYGVRSEDWRIVADPLPGCQHDWLCPVRVPGREAGTPRWGELERLVDGTWRPVDPSERVPTIPELIEEQPSQND